MKQTFYSNGKLLLTGEYVVLDGAKALAIPTKFGQDLVVDNGINRQIQWRSFDSDGSIWYEDIITFEEITSAQKGHATTVRITLIEILQAAFRLNPDFLKTAEGYSLETHLTFPKLWGLGTSSTLINNIAQWLNIDPFTLLNGSFGGSGYDIAAARHNNAIVYQLINEKPLVSEIKFNPPFSHNIWFVYLNRKQSSKAAIASYYTNRNNHLSRKINELNNITEVMSVTQNPGIFAREMHRHESIISDILEMKTVRESFFPDFDGEVKSLGGWGGDFIMALSKKDPTDYFTQKGFPTVVSFSDMVLSQ